MSRKAVLSFLITTILLAIFAVFAFARLFNLLEVRFYNPAITKTLIGELNQVVECTGDFLGELQDEFAATLNEGAVRRSFLPIQNDEDIFERSRIFGILHEKLQGLQWVRFVDMGGTRLHFSTSPQDILRQDGTSLAYRNYQDTIGAIPYGDVHVPNKSSPILTLDNAGERIIFSYPFYDTFEVYRGTALFSLSIRMVAEQLIIAGLLKPGEEVSAVSDPPGILAALPRAGGGAIISQVSSLWQSGTPGLDRLDSAEAGKTLVLLSSKTVQGIYTGWLVDESLFFFPSTLKIILLVSFFLTVYLTIFLLFNLRQDPLLVIQNRLKRLQVSLLEQFYDLKSGMDWIHWNLELEQRRAEVHREIKRGLTFKSGGADADIFIDKFWDEMLTQIGGPRNVPQVVPAPVVVHNLPLETETLEELESPDDTEEPEVLEELEDGEEPGELEELEEVIEELEPLEEDLEELEPLEEVSSPETESGPALQDPASQIEFSPLPEELDIEEPLPLQGKIEIVSPLATMFAKEPAASGTDVNTDHPRGDENGV